MTYLPKSSSTRRGTVATVAALVLASIVAVGSPSPAAAQRRDRGEHRSGERHDRGHHRGNANYREHDRSRVVVVRPTPPRAYGPRVVYTSPYVAPPPPRRVVSRPPPPRPDTIWVEGYWQWTGNQYVWSPGYWEVIRPRHRFVQAHWEQRGRTWVLVPAMWVSVR